MLYRLLPQPALSKRLPMLKTVVRLLFCLTCVFWTAYALAQEKETWHRWEDEIRRYEAIDRQHPPPTGAVLFIGSSSISLWDGLAADLPGVPVLNRGFGGAQVRDVTFFIDRIVTPYRPRTIVFYAGDNDVGEGRSPAQVTADVMEFLHQARKRLPDVRFVFVSIKPSPVRAHRLPAIQETNRLIRGFLARLDGTTYIDIHTPMLQANNRIRTQLFREDGLHMNASGYALWREIIGPHIN